MRRWLRRKRKRFRNCSEDMPVSDLPSLEATEDVLDLPAIEEPDAAGQ